MRGKTDSVALANATHPFAIRAMEKRSGFAGNKRSEIILSESITSLPSSSANSPSASPISSSWPQHSSSFSPSLAVRPRAQRSQQQLSQAYSPDVYVPSSAPAEYSWSLRAALYTHLEKIDQRWPTEGAV